MPTADIFTEVSIELLNISYPVISLSGTEAINIPFEYKLSVADSVDVTSDKLQGSCAILTFTTIPPNFASKTRKIKGIISHCRERDLNTENPKTLELTLSPIIHKLKLSQSPKLYKNLTRLDMAKRLLYKHGYLSLHLRFVAEERKQDVCPLLVQAEGETDFAYFTRLLSKEGINYYFEPSTDGEESIVISAKGLWPLALGDNTYSLSFEDFLLAKDITSVFNLQLKGSMATYKVKYRDMSFEDNNEIWEATFGDGEREVSIWGHGAQKKESLERFVRNHHEYLHMEKETYHIDCHDVSLFAGSGIRIAPSPLWKETKVFRILAINHNYEDGIYRNSLKLIEATTPVRPPPIKRNAGQTVHTARIEANADLAYLDKEGAYTYAPHIYKELETREDMPKAKRLTPYAETAQDKAFGMHFPLRRNAEVLVMYLHNDFNQPILQNSPQNELNQAPIRRDNSWNILLKTAHNQYLRFSDKPNLYDITLANADDNNKLELKEHIREQAITLESKLGSIVAKAQDKTSLTAANGIEMVSGASSFKFAKELRLESGGISHMQGDSIDLEAKKINIKAKGNIELSGIDINIASDETINLEAEGEFVVNAEDELEFVSDNLEISAKDNISLSGGGSYIMLDRKGVTLSGKSINLNSPNVQMLGKLNKGAKSSAPINDLVSIKPLNPVRHYEFLKTKDLTPPTWEQPLYRYDDIGKLTFAIRGFKGNENVELAIVRANTKEGESHPFVSSLIDAPIVYTKRFTLIDDDIYAATNNKAMARGNALISLDVPIKELIHDNTDSFGFYYAYVNVGDVGAERCSDALALLCDIKITIKTEKGVLFKDEDAIVSLYRHLPKSATKIKNPPKIKESRYYLEPLYFKDVVASDKNLIKLKVAGKYLELLDKEYKNPYYIKPITVKMQKDVQEIELKLLTPPMIMNLRDAYLEGDKIVFKEESYDARAELREHEVEYIKNNGNNLTIFIHGFNVEHGSFENHHPHPRDTDYEMDATHATIYRDGKEIAGKPGKIDDFMLEALNGKQLHQWVTMLEHNLNKAAGFDGEDYQRFTRCLFISWKGNPSSPVNYFDAVRESIRTGPIFAKIINTIRRQVEGVKINVIAHSQGNGVLIHALNYLGFIGHRSVSRAIFWQAAIPNTAFSDTDVEKYGELTLDKLNEINKTKLWFCPFAYKAADKITVLYSKNDNVLGKLLNQDEMPEGLKVADVWDRKPFVEELIPALILISLGFNSLYCIASLAGATVSELMSSRTRRKLWELWQQDNPTIKCPFTGTIYPTKKTLKEQSRFFVSTGLFARLNQMYEENYCKYKQEAKNYVQQAYGEKVNFEQALKYMKAKAFLYAPLSKDEVQKIFGVTFDSMWDMLDKDETTLPRNEGSSVLTSIPLVHELLVILHAKNLSTNQKEIVAMGYDDPRNNKGGIDSGLLDMIDSDLIQIENTTKWVWFHSDMKTPNQSCFENVYEDRIANKRLGLEVFGTYEILDKEPRES